MKVPVSGLVLKVQVKVQVPVNPPLDMGFCMVSLGFLIMRMLKLNYYPCPPPEEKKLEKYK